MGSSSLVPRPSHMCKKELVFCVTFLVAWGGIVLQLGAQIRWKLCLHDVHEHILNCELQVEQKLPRSLSTAVPRKYVLTFNWGSFSATTLTGRAKSGLMYPVAVVTSAGSSSLDVGRNSMYSSWNFSNALHCKVEKGSIYCLSGGGTLS